MINTKNVSANSLTSHVTISRYLLTSLFTISNYFWSHLAAGAKSCFELLGNQKLLVPSQKQIYLDCLYWRLYC